MRSASVLFAARSAPCASKMTEYGAVPFTCASTTRRAYDCSAEAKTPAEMDAGRIPARPTSLAIDAAPASSSSSSSRPSSSASSERSSARTPSTTISRRRQRSSPPPSPSPSPSPAAAGGASAERTISSKRCLAASLSTAYIEAPSSPCARSRPAPAASLRAASDPYRRQASTCSIAAASCLRGAPAPASSRRSSCTASRRAAPKKASAQPCSSPVSLPAPSISISRSAHPRVTRASDRLSRRCRSSSSAVAKRVAAVQLPLQLTCRRTAAQDAVPRPSAAAPSRW